MTSALPLGSTGSSWGLMEGLPSDVLALIYEHFPVNYQLGVLGRVSSRFWHAVAQVKRVYLLPTRSPLLDHVNLPDDSFFRLYSRMTSLIVGGNDDLTDPDEERSSLGAHILPRRHLIRRYQIEPDQLYGWLVSKNLDTLTQFHCNIPMGPMRNWALPNSMPHVTDLRLVCSEPDGSTRAVFESLLELPFLRSLSLPEITVSLQWDDHVHPFLALVPRLDRLTLRGLMVAWPAGDPVALHVWSRRLQTIQLLVDVGTDTAPVIPLYLVLPCAFPNLLEATVGGLHLNNHRAIRTGSLHMMAAFLEQVSPPRPLGAEELTRWCHWAATGAAPFEEMPEARLLDATTVPQYGTVPGQAGGRKEPQISRGGPKGSKGRADADPDDEGPRGKKKDRRGKAAARGGKRQPDDEVKEAGGDDDDGGQKKEPAPAPVPAELNLTDTLVAEMLAPLSARQWVLTGLRWAVHNLVQSLGGGDEEAHLRVAAQRRLVGLAASISSQILRGCIHEALRPLAALAPALTRLELYDQDLQAGHCELAHHKAALAEDRLHSHLPLAPAPRDRWRTPVDPRAELYTRTPAPASGHPRATGAYRLAYRFGEALPCLQSLKLWFGDTEQNLANPRSRCPCLLPWLDISHPTLRRLEVRFCVSEGAAVRNEELMVPGLIIDCRGLEELVRKIMDKTSAEFKIGTNGGYYAGVQDSDKSSKWVVLTGNTIQHRLLLTPTFLTCPPFALGVVQVRMGPHADIGQVYITALQQQAGATPGTVGLCPGLAVGHHAHLALRRVSLIREPLSSVDQWAARRIREVPHRRLICLGPHNPVPEQPGHRLLEATDPRYFLPMVGGLADPAGLLAAHLATREADAASGGMLPSDGPLPGLAARDPATGAPVRLCPLLQCYLPALRDLEVSMADEQRDFMAWIQLPALERLTMQLHPFPPRRPGQEVGSSLHLRCPALRHLALSTAPEWVVGRPWQAKGATGSPYLSTPLLRMEIECPALICTAHEHTATDAVTKLFDHLSAFFFHHADCDTAVFGPAMEAVEAAWAAAGINPAKPPRMPRIARTPEAVAAQEADEWAAFAAGETRRRTAEGAALKAADDQFETSMRWEVESALEGREARRASVKNAKARERAEAYREREAERLSKRTSASTDPTASATATVPDVPDPLPPLRLVQDRPVGGVTFYAEHAACICSPRTEAQWRQATLAGAHLAGAGLGPQAATAEGWALRMGLGGTALGSGLRFLGPDPLRFVPPPPADPAALRLPRLGPLSMAGWAPLRHVRVRLTADCPEVRVQSGALEVLLIEDFAWARTFECACPRLRVLGVCSPPYGFGAQQFDECSMMPLGRTRERARRRRARRQQADRGESPDPPIGYLAHYATAFSRCPAPQLERFSLCEMDSLEQLHLDWGLNSRHLGVAFPSAPPRMRALPAIEWTAPAGGSGPCQPCRLPALRFLSLCRASMPYLAVVDRPEAAPSAIPVAVARQVQVAVAPALRRMRVWGSFTDWVYVRAGTQTEHVSIEVSARAAPKGPELDLVAQPSSAPPGLNLSTRPFPLAVSSAPIRIEGFLCHDIIRQDLPAQLRMGSTTILQWQPVAMRELVAGRLPEAVAPWATLPRPVGAAGPELCGLVALDLRRRVAHARGPPRRVRVELAGLPNLERVRLADWAAVVDLATGPRCALVEVATWGWLTGLRLRCPGARFLTLDTAGPGQAALAPNRLLAAAAAAAGAAAVGAGGAAVLLEAPQLRYLSLTGCQAADLLAALRPAALPQLEVLRYAPEVAPTAAQTALAATPRYQEWARRQQAQRRRRLRPTECGEEGDPVRSPWTADPADGDLEAALRPVPVDVTLGPADLRGARVLVLALPPHPAPYTRCPVLGRVEVASDHLEHVYLPPVDELILDECAPGLTIHADTGLEPAMVTAPEAAERLEMYEPWAHMHTPYRSRGSGRVFTPHGFRLMMGPPAPRPTDQPIPALGPRFAPDEGVPPVREGILGAMRLDDMPRGSFRVEYVPMRVAATMVPGDGPRLSLGRWDKHPSGLAATLDRLWSKKEAADA
ncbi:hypothetical protein PAPYR_7009 [Paratrimastix pyriformis]|uniref:F-box domain-containing protein n=1 Tax=Paratrimastix pyriformis TaxID=342808 RepID=A0ABQ8UIJ1_9EUKA|nr:hypothetical protein PAPYR_7009 [Paratrimastix pyriformis]